MADLRKASPELTQSARQLRKDATPEEQVLWDLLRGRRFKGTRWLRQYPTHGYILDFYCAKFRLFVELDGPQHLEPEAIEYDAARTAFLNARTWRVLRVTNAEIRDDVASVLDKIAAELE